MVDLHDELDLAFDRLIAHSLITRRGIEVTVTDAIAEANRLRSSVQGEWTVEAAPDPSGMRLTFSWGYYTRDDSYSKAPNVPLLEVRAELEQRPGEWGTPVVEVAWEPGEPPDAVGARLIDALRRAGRWEGETTLDWGLALTNLQRTVGGGRLPPPRPRGLAPRWRAV